MTKREYMARLDGLLDPCDEEYKADILSAIEEHFAEGLAQGRSEEEIVAELGDPREAAGVSEETDQEEHGSAGAERPFFAENMFGAVSGFVDRIMETVNRSIDAAAGGRWEHWIGRERNYRPIENGASVTSVIVSGTSADVTAEPAEGDEILFDYDPENGPDAVLTVEGNVLAIASAEKWHGLSGSLFLRLPARVRLLTLDLTSGDADVKSLALDGLTFRGTSGDVDLRDIETGELDITVTSGDLDAVGVRCRQFNARAASGDLSFEGRAEYGKINTASGDVELELTQNPESIRVTTASGDVELHVPESAGVLFRTVSGDASTGRPHSRGPGGVYIGRDAPVRVEVTTASGDLSV